jgi:hypothetical protein
MQNVGQIMMQIDKQAAIVWTLHGFMTAPGRKYAFTVSVNDQDSTNRERQVSVPNRTLAEG